MAQRVKVDSAKDGGEGMITLLLTIGIVAAFFALILPPVFWSTHLFMTKNGSDRQAWGTFEDFKREYAAYPGWVRKRDWRKSHFGDGSYYDDYYIHADIIKFKGLGMKLRFFSYLRYLVWIERHKLPAYNNKNWNEAWPHDPN